MSMESCELASELLCQQRDELELLRAMFPTPGELHLDDTFDSNVCLQLKLTLGSTSAEMSAELSPDYPLALPDVFVRSDSLHRSIQRQLNDDMNEYIKSLDRGEPCLYNIISWLQDNSEKYFITKIDNKEKQKAKCKDRIEKYGRLWIYSHHIYNKTKRKTILSLAEEFELTGFSLPGKPGIICVEGGLTACEEWWLHIRSMNWKKIVIKKKEETSINEKFAQKFDKFEEISFQSNANRGTDYHMDMGKFYKYLEDHDCSYIFMDYFGMSGRS